MIKKQFLKTKCRVTFEVTAEAVNGVETAALVGDFNEWNPQATPMEHKKNKFTVRLDLELDRVYQYRYLINQIDWQNDDRADAYTPNPFNGQNSVLMTYPTEAVEL